MQNLLFSRVLTLAELRNDGSSSEEVSFPVQDCCPFVLSTGGRVGLKATRAMTETLMRLPAVPGGPRPAHI